MGDDRSIPTTKKQLLALARRLGVSGVRSLSIPELILAIHTIRAREQSPIRIVRDKVSFKTPGQKQFVQIRNESKRSLQLGLDIREQDGAFRLTEQAAETTVRAGETLRAGVIFDPRGPTGIFAASVLYRGGLTIRDLKSDTVLGVIDVKGIGPGFVPVQDWNCIVEPVREQPARPENSPPVITLSVTPELAWPGETVRVSWTVTGADGLEDQVWEGSSHVFEDVWPDGTFGDWGGGTGPTAERSRSFSFTMYRTTTFNVSAQNREGTTHAEATAWLKVRVGYRGASIPGGGVRVEHVNRVRGWLEEVDLVLRKGCIRDNTNLDRFHGPEGGRYLRNGLTDDILKAMGDVVVHTSPATVPRIFRRTLRLCQCGPCPSSPTLTCATAGQAQNQSVEGGFLGVCWMPETAVRATCAVRGDALTLLHELYHYASRFDWYSEEKAHAISACDLETCEGGCFLTDADCSDSLGDRCH